MDKQERDDLIAQYRDGYTAVSEAVLRISQEELNARPAPNRWSPCEIIHHLADSELLAAVRLRLLLAEDRPAIQAVDPDAFARRLHYDRPYESSLELFQLVRQSTAELLDRLSPEDWLREGVHSELGAYSVERWLRTYARHAHRHARQILEARSAANKVRGGNPQ